LSDEDKALFYVKEASKTFRSQVSSWVISHEKTGEQKTLAQLYGIPAAKVTRFEADAGVTEANTLLRGDYTKPHPFFPDERVPETGLYRLGCPYIFFLVERKAAPRDDRDMKTFREQVSTQRWTEEKLTDLGLSKTIPMKIASDHPDAFRMFSVNYAMPQMTKKTVRERVQDKVKPEYRFDPTVANTPEQEMSRKMAEIFAKEQLRAELGMTPEEFREEYG
jgi:hypothetical protein